MPFALLPAHEETGSVRHGEKGSANGTWGDGQRTDGWVTLEEGQPLQLGSFRVPPRTIQEWLIALGTGVVEGHPKRALGKN